MQFRYVYSASVSEESDSGTYTTVLFMAHTPILPIATMCMLLQCRETVNASYYSHSVINQNLSVQEYSS